jgi:hypothetical protein
MIGFFYYILLDTRSNHHEDFPLGLHFFKVQGSFLINSQYSVFWFLH